MTSMIHRRLWVALARAPLVIAAARAASQRLDDAIREANRDWSYDARPPLPEPPDGRLPGGGMNRRSWLALKIAPWLFVPRREERDEAFKMLAEVAYGSRDAVWTSPQTLVRTALQRRAETIDLRLCRGTPDGAWGAATAEAEDGHA